jgi:hypothetical protein
VLQIWKNDFIQNIYGTVYDRNIRERENHKLLLMDEKPLFVEEHTYRIMYTCMAERRKEKEISGNQ